MAKLLCAGLWLYAPHWHPAFVITHEAASSLCCTMLDQGVIQPPKWTKAGGGDAAVDGDAEQASSTLNLGNCLKQFATCEQLSEMDTW